VVLPRTTKKGSRKGTALSRNFTQEELGYFFLAL
jgi:hypothetical protein